MTPHPRRIILIPGNKQNCICDFITERRVARVIIDGELHGYEISCCEKCGIVIMEPCDKDRYRDDGKRSDFGEVERGKGERKE